MKISAINHNCYNNNSKNDRVPSFKAYFDEKKMKWFEHCLKQAKKRGAPYLTSKDELTMRNSIKSFNAFYRGAKNASAWRIEDEIYEKLKIPADFKDDKYLACMNALALNIFKKLKLPLPTALTKTKLQNKCITARCLTANRAVEFNEDVDWSDQQFYMIYGKLTNQCSTGHFLSTILHEYMHNVHLENLHKIAADRKRNIQNSASSLIRNFAKMDFKTDLIMRNAKEITNPYAKQYITQKVSRYGSTLPAEMFADMGAKMITDNLHPCTLLPTRNPFVFKNFTEDRALIKMMEDIWQGDFSKYTG